jgi:hypothetical protein
MIPSLVVHSLSYLLKSVPAEGLDVEGNQRDVRDLEARHCHEELRGEIGPHRIAVEVRTVKRIPRRVHNVASEISSWIGALPDDGARMRMMTIPK